MTETQQRFLRAIAERVPVNQVVELHLFPSIRQGGVETGVAVVAEDPRPVPNVSAAVLDEAVAEPEAQAVGVESVQNEIEVVSEPVSDDSVAMDMVEADIANAEDPFLVEAADADADDDESPYADGEDEDEDEADDEAEDAEEEPEAITAPLNGGRAPTAPAARYTIHTARYRLTLKGVDRGKWEVDVHAEADAPLAAVDAVVRGVQRRAGESLEPDRLNAEAFRGALEAPLATLER
jgi:hypothetical protein